MTNTAGVEYLALRPLLSDYVMSMPRGAAVVYPKDSGPDRPDGRHLPRARPSSRRASAAARCRCHCSGPSASSGRLLSFERREDFAEIARGNGRAFFGGDHPAWTVTVGDLVESLPDRRRAGHRRPRRARHARAVGVPRRRLRRAHPRRRAHLLRRDDHPAEPGRRGHPRRTAASPSPAPGSRSCAAGTSRASPFARSTACTATPASSSPPAASLPASCRPSASADPPRAPTPWSTGVAVRRRWSCRCRRMRRERHGVPGSTAATDVPDDAWTPEAMGERVKSDKTIRRVRRSLAETSDDNG